MSSLTRRAILAGSGCALFAGAEAALAGGAVGRLHQIADERTATLLTPREAYDLAQAGRILLVDVRRPDEWAATGSPAGGVRLDMRRLDFFPELQRLTNGRRDVPIAFICSGGVRSARVARALVRAGFTQIIDVPEGMSGSPAGPGWVRRGLPVDRR